MSDLFDYAAGKAAKEEGMERVDAAADDDWKDAAERAVKDAARSLPEITSDDVMARIAPDVRTHELRALGPVMSRAAKAGWIRKADKAPRLCARPSRHRAPLTVWTSLIYGRH